MKRNILTWIQVFSFITWTLPPSSGVAGSVLYRMQTCDSVSNIVWRLNFDRKQSDLRLVSGILQANHLKRNTPLSAGHVLKIPSKYFNNQLTETIDKNGYAHLPIYAFHSRTAYIQENCMYARDLGGRVDIGAADSAKEKNHDAVQAEKINQAVARAVAQAVPPAVEAALQDKIALLNVAPAPAPAPAPVTVPVPVPVQATSSHESIPKHELPQKLERSVGSVDTVALVVTNAPTETPVPVVPPAPVVTPVPVVAPAPIATPVPVVAPAPVVTPVPVDAPKPAATPVLVDAPKPVVTPVPVVATTPVAAPTPLVAPTPVVTPAPVAAVTPSASSPTNSRSPQDDQSKLGVRAYLATGVLFFYSAESINSVDAHYEQFESPTVHGGLELSVTDIYSLGLEYFKAPLDFDNSPAGLANASSNISIMTIETMARVAHSDSSEYRIGGGIEALNLPLMLFADTDNTPIIVDAHMLGLSLGFDGKSRFSPKTRGSISTRMTYPLLFGGAGGQAKSHVSSPIMFSGAIGVEKKMWGDSSWLGLYWHGFYHGFNFDYSDSRVTAVGTHKLLLSSPEIRWSFDF